MAYQALVIPVMVASPGDVSPEREAIREAIHDWNDVNSARSSVVLVPVGWDSHSSPELGARPQELINTRLLRECDLLIGVFWTRVGTPTGRAISGTVEEIQEHLAAGKPAMIYFSAKPVAPDSVDPDQYKALKEFKTWCREQGLVEEFDDLDQFRRKLSKHLPLALANNNHLQSLINAPGEGATAAPLEPARDAGIQLSQTALELLKAAASDENGHIYKMAYLDGTHIEAGGKSYGDGGRREAAKWEAALEELLENGLVVRRGYKDQVFELTHAGWKVADER